MEYDAESGKQTMEVDFLGAKSKLQRKHNIVPIEVKSAREYSTRSLDKFVSKFASYSAAACVLHEKDLVRAEGKVFLPMYMAGFMSWIE